MFSVHDLFEESKCYLKKCQHEAVKHVLYSEPVEIKPEESRLTDGRMHLSQSGLTGDIWHLQHAH